MTRSIAVHVVGLLVALASGCGHLTHEYLVAPGSSGELPYHNKRCSTDAQSSVRLEPGRFFHAVAPGRAEFECGDDTYVFKVEKVARIELKRWPGSDPDSAGYQSISLFAYDDKGAELYLGNSTRVEWTVPDTLEQRSGCHGDILPRCDPGYTIGVRPSAPGDHRVGARFAGLEASLDLDARVDQAVP